MAGLGTELIVALSVATHSSQPAKGLTADAISALGTACLYASVALALAIHRPYPRKHEGPEDFSRLFKEGPYKVCSIPSTQLLMITQASVAIFIGYALEASMTFAYEPAAYLPGRGGVRIEPHVLVTGEGCEILTPIHSDLLK